MGEQRRNLLYFRTPLIYEWVSDGIDLSNIEKDLRNIIYEVAEENDVEIKAMEIMPDHVHLFISFDTRQHIHKIIQQFKGRSSRILREKYLKLKSRIPSLWTRSCFCCTVGHISEEAVMKYIEEQKHA